MWCLKTKSVSQSKTYMSLFQYILGIYQYIHVCTIFTSTYSVYTSTYMDARKTMISYNWLGFQMAEWQGHWCIVRCKKSYPKGSLTSKELKLGGSHAFARLLTATLGISISCIWNPTHHLESSTIVYTSIYQYILVYTMLWYITVYNSRQNLIPVYTGIYFFLNFTKKYTGIYKYMIFMKVYTRIY
jgi:hypothetical protein